MSSGQVLKLEEIRAARAELDQFSKGEYGPGLEQLLIDGGPDAALRIQRLPGSNGRGAGFLREYKNRGALDRERQMSKRRKGAASAAPF